MFFTKLRNIIFFPILSSLLSCCSDDCQVNQTANEEGEIMIVLRIPTGEKPEYSRAFPSGGEDGDGREEGLSFENKVFDANIFFFEGSGFNSYENPAKISVAGVYVNDVSSFTSEPDDYPFEKKITLKIKQADTNLEQKGILSATDISFITVLNAGRDLSEDITNLESLRNYNGFSGSFSKTSSGYERFLMTTAYDADKAGFIDIAGTKRFVGSNRLEKNLNADAFPGDNWKGKKWIGETTVQRLCARVDLMYTDNNIGSDELLYSTETGNKVHITNILPVNFMSNPSYLLTKTTENIPDSWTETGLGNIIWGGVETTNDGSDIPANYIIEPTTIAKASGNKNLSSWFGNSAAESVKEDITLPSNGSVSSCFSGNLTVTENNGYTRFSIIGYANENIQSPACYNSDFISGIALRALFQPKVLYQKNGEDFLAITVSDENWESMTDEERTFWRYRPSRISSMIKDGDMLYFANEEDALDYSKNHPADLAEITKFDKGICYYNLWLRHYNNEDYKESDSAIKDTYPMEYAIVRNNIYRVALSFSGPGTPTPEMRQPDTMSTRIFVRKWNPRYENNPMQF